MTDFDEILKNVGQLGRFQLYILSLVSILCILTTWQCFLHAFIGLIPRHRCEISECDNATTSYSADWLNNTVPGKYDDDELWVPNSCRRYENLSIVDQCHAPSPDSRTRKCSKWKFDTSDFESTIATEWHLVCGKEYLVSLVGSVNLAGGFLGLVLMGYLSDRFGRKTGILISLFFLGATGVASSLAPDAYSLMAFRFLIEAAESSLFQLVFVLVAEFIGPDKRVIGAQLIQLTYSIGEMLLAGIASIIRTWRMLQLATAVPAFIFLCYYWFLPESARWLIANKRTKEANAIIKKMAAWNKGIVVEELTPQQYGSVSSNNSTDMPSDQKQLFQEPVVHHTTLDLFRTPKLRLRTIIIMANWLLNVLVYNGITLGSTGIPHSSAQLSFFLMGAVEVPANLLSMYTMHKLGRKITLSGAFIITGIPLVIIQFLPQEKEYVWGVLAMTMIGKFGSTMGNAVLYLFSAELFPTVVRNSGLGIAGIVGTFGSTIAPQIMIIAQYQPSLPYIIYGVMSLIGACVSLLLPETLGKQLPETIEDAENFGS